MKNKATNKYFRFKLIGEGSYIQPLEELMQCLDAELDAFKDGYIGDKITIELEIIDITEDDYNHLQEFQGWQRE